MTKYYLLLLLIQNCGATADKVPVFILDYDEVLLNLHNIKSNPFMALGSEYLHSILREAKRKCDCILIFVENTLCTEDLSVKDELGTPFTHLRWGLSENKFKYIPSVEDPYAVLKKQFPPLQTNVVYLSADSSLELNNPSLYLYIYFQDSANMTRGEVLRSHDTTIRQVYYAVKETTLGPVVGFYTGKVNANLRRVRRLPFTGAGADSIAVPKEGAVMLVSDRALFKFSGIHMARRSRTRSGFEPRPLIGHESWSRKKLSTSIQYADLELRFNFKFTPVNWILETVSLYQGGEVVGVKSMGVYAPWNWSYVCGYPLTIHNARDGSVFTISKYQIQPRTLAAMGGSQWSQRQTRDGGGPDNSSTNPPTTESTTSEPTTTESPSKDDECFGESVNCEPYFTAQILSGLFVVFICLSITTFGVLMLLSCSANDRYCDPNAKDIIVHSEAAQQ